MQEKIKKSIIVFLLFIVCVVFIVPSVASAAWWNPFSWSIWNIFKSSHTTIIPANTQNTAPTSQNNPAPANKPAIKTITDDNFGIAIKVPTSWVKLQYPDGMQNTSVGFKKGFQKFEIIKQNLPNGVSFESWLKIWITTQKNVVSSNDTTIDGKTAYKVIRNNDSTENPKAITIFINGGDKTYQLDWLMDENYFNNSQTEINQVLNSIHFTK